MNARLPASRLLPLIAAFLLGLILVFAVVFQFVGRSASPIGSALASIGGPFALEDQNGKPFTDRDMKGRPHLVFFGYTHCPDVCPTTLFEISELIKKLGPDAARAGVIFITVDPERDTPAVMKDYLSNFDPHLRGLTGDPAAVARRSRPIGSTPRKFRSRTATTPWITPPSST